MKYHKNTGVLQTARKVKMAFGWTNLQDITARNGTRPQGDSVEKSIAHVSFINHQVVEFDVHIPL
jgi:hypothetical protein